MQLPRIDAHLSPSHFLTLSLSHLLSPLPRAFGALRSRFGRAPVAACFFGKAVIKLWTCRGRAMNRKIALVVLGSPAKDLQAAALGLASFTDH
jgi:hypothetical protein